MKKGLVVLLIFTSNCLLAQKQVIDKVIATVGGELVLLSEIEEQHALMQDQNSNLPEGVRCNILAQIMGSKLLLNQAKLDSILVADAEVETQLNARIERILTYMNNDVSQFEAYYGQTVNEVKEQVREDMKNQLLVERMRNSVIQSITVTPSEVKDFFNRIPNDSLPYFNSEVEIGEIVYRPKVNENQKNIAINLLDSIRNLIITEQATFEEMAQTFSDDGSARAGGDLGWTKRGKFVQEFEAAAYNLDKDEISEVTETEFGYHIIQLQERRGNTIRVRHILIKPEITDADLEAAEMHLDSIRNLVSTDSMTFSVAVKLFSDDNEQSYNNDGRMVNPASGNTFFEIGDLDPDIYFTIDTMEVGQVSAPFEFTDPRGETGYRIVQLQSQTAPHRANLEQDYAKIVKAAKDSKQSGFIGTWIEEKVSSTYLNIDAMYDGCPNLENWRKKETKP